MENLVKVSVRLAAPVGWLFMLSLIMWWGESHREEGQTTLTRQADALERIAAALEATAQK